MGGSGVRRRRHCDREAPAIIVPQGPLLLPERLEARFSSPGFDGAGRIFELHIDPIDRVFLLAPDLVVHVQERGFSCQAQSRWSEAVAKNIRRQAIGRWRGASVEIGVLDPASSS